jgi:uncharacterized protein YkwD
MNKLSALERMAVYGDSLQYMDLEHAQTLIEINGEPDDMLDMVNDERARYGARPLVLSQELMCSAQAKSDDMYNRDYYSHVDPDGNRSRYAENIAMGQATLHAVFEAWRTSSGHHANMIDRRWQRLGIGYNNRLWTQHFS